MFLVWLLVLVLGGAVCWCCWMAFKAVCLIAEEHGAVITGVEIGNAVERVIRSGLEKDK